MSRLFDPKQNQALLEQDLEENATRRDPLPPGEVLGQIVDVKLSTGEIKKGDRRGETWTRVDCKIEITDQEYLAQYGDGTQSKATTTLGVMVETNDRGNIATGPNKNVRLGKLRDACGVNGKPLSALNGQFLRLTIGHKPHPDDPEITLDEITAYTKA